MFGGRLGDVRLSRYQRIDPYASDHMLATITADEHTSPRVMSDQPLSKSDQCLFAFRLHPTSTFFVCWKDFLLRDFHH